MENTEIDNVKSIWRDDSLQDDWSGDMVSKWIPRFEKFRKMIIIRNIIEIVSSVFCILVFIIYFIEFPSLVSRIGCGIVIASLVFIIMTFVRTWVKKRDESVTVREAVYTYKRELERQISLLKNVLLWYLLPLATGLIVFLSGLDISVTAFIVVLGIILTVHWIVYRLNRRALKKKLLPHYNEICALLDSLEEE